jgi:predicted DNA-binding protein
MMTVPVYLEQQILNIAKQHNIAPDELVAQAIIDYLEDFEDIKAIELAKQEIASGEAKFITLTEFKNELNDLVN